MAVPARQLSFRLEDLPVEISTQIWFTIFADLPFAGKVVEVNFSREIIYHKGRDRGYGKPRRIPAKFVNTYKLEANPAGGVVEPEAARASPEALRAWGRYMRDIQGFKAISYATQKKIWIQPALDTVFMSPLSLCNLLLYSAQNAPWRPPRSIATPAAKVARYLHGFHHIQMLATQLSDNAHNNKAVGDRAIRPTQELVGIRGISLPVQAQVDNFMRLTFGSTVDLFPGLKSAQYVLTEHETNRGWTSDTLGKIRAPTHRPYGAHEVTYVEEHDVLLEAIENTAPPSQMLNLLLSREIRAITALGMSY